METCRFPVFLGLTCLPASIGAQPWLPDVRKSPVPVEAYHAERMQLVDIDRDGSLDLVRAAQLGSTPLWRGVGDGRFAVVGSPLYRSFLADLDGDGDLDLCTSSSVYEQTAAWIFQHRTTIPAGIVAAANLDGDPLPDLIGSAQGYRNLGSYQFLATVSFPVGHSDLRRFADLDGDGDADLLAVIQDSLVTFANEGGRFRQAQVLPVSAPIPDLLVDDLDGDGDPDILLLGPRPNPIAWNDGGPTMLRLSPRPVFGLSFDPTCAIVGDLDGDGRPDLVFGGDTPWLAVARGRDGEVFEATSADLTATSHPVQSLAGGDVDADGDLDALVNLGQGSGSNWGTGTDLVRNLRGRLHALRQPMLPSALLWLVPAHACAADFNGDGDVDLLMTDGVHRVYLGDGRGGFPGFVPLDSSQRGAPHAGDIDCDGDLDAVLVAGDRLAVLRNVGGGRMLPSRSWPIPIGFQEAVASGRLGDFDGDGDLDVLVLRWKTWPPYRPPAADVLLENDGTGAFPVARTLRTAMGVPDPLVVDIDGDGDTDVIAGDTAYLNDGNAGFSPATLGAWGNTLAAGDLDGDGDLDIVTAGSCNYQCTDGGPSFVVWQDAPGQFRSQRLPTSTVHFVGGVALVDADGDGDLDVFLGERLINYGGPDQLARNDGGQRFVDASSELERSEEDTFGVIAHDIDHDGDDDVIAWIGHLGGVVVRVNTSRHLTSPDPVRVGRGMRLHVDGATGGALLLAAPGAARIGTPYGRFGLDPHGLVVVGAVRAAAPRQRVTLELAVPDVPDLVGGTVWWQALIVDGTGPRYSNVIRDVVLPR